MKRQIAYGTLTLVSIVIFGAILILLNVIPRQIKVLNVFGTRVPLQKQWDLTANKRYSLSDQSIKVVRNLKAPVEIIAFAQANSAEERKLEDTLKRYSYETRNFTYRIEDPEKNPLIARKYGVKSARTLIMLSQGKKENVNLPASGDDTGTESRITAALMRLSNPKPATVYFSRGHGEREVDDKSAAGLSWLKDALTGENYQVKDVFLFNSKAVPDDCTVFVVAGLTKDFFPEEIKMLEAFAARGGRTLWLVGLPFDRSTEYKFPNVQKYLATQGIEVQDDLVVGFRILAIKTPMRLLMPLFERYAPNHPLTQGFRDAAVFPLARSVKAGKAPAGAQVESLLFTTNEAVQYPDPIQAAQVIEQAQNPLAALALQKNARKGEASGGVAGTYPVNLSATPSPAPSASPSAAAAPTAGPAASASPAPSASPSAMPASPRPSAPAASPSPSASAVAASPGASPSPSPSASPETRSEARVVVFGSSDFAIARYRGVAGNSDLALNAIAWLAERSEQLTIKRPETKNAPVALDEDTKARVNWFAQAVVPGLLLILGIFVHLTFKRH